jgi:RNA methyltransferase, TrmH family
MLVKSKVKYIQSLGQKKFREKEGLFIAEGPKLVGDLLQNAAVDFTEVFALPDWIKANGELAKRVSVTEIEPADLEKISQLITPNEVLAIVKQFSVAETIDTKGQVILSLDGIQDPGNMGTLIRIADWFGIKQLVCSLDSADIYNPKVVQATMGSIARVAVHYTDLQQWLNDNSELKVYATTLEGEDVTTMPKITQGVVLIGNESKGIRAEVLELAKYKITIPKKGSAESLNAGVAAGVVFSHLV